MLAGTDWLLKRAFDLAVSALVIVAGLPLWLLVAVAIKITSRGPILYRDARIGLGEQEAVRTCAQLEAVFGLIEQLQSVDTRGVEPMTHPGEAGLRLRDDVADEPQRREEYQAVAPSVERGLYLVPRVIE